VIDTVYVEDAVGEHPRTLEVLRRLPRATVIPCRHYGELFNAHNQSFRLQKRNPSLILARKEGERLHAVPAGFGVGGAPNVYFSHLLNCPYDCRYCFLQGMFRSASYVLFVDYEEFFSAIREHARAALAADPAAQPWYFSGYDCDSLALDGLTGFAPAALETFAELPGAWLELRTKSTQLSALWSSRVLENVVVAYSLSPATLAATAETGTPGLPRRLAALQRLSAAGWKVGLRFDPVLWFEDAPLRYLQLLDQVAAAVPEQSVHSVSLGTFRLPRDFARTIGRMHPQDPLLAAAAYEEEGSLTYDPRVREALVDPLQERIVELWGEERFYPCGETAAESASTSLR
jgi:spore photoproduct lyase